MPFLDQVAQADTWKQSDRVISATYTGDPQTGEKKREFRLFSALLRLFFPLTLIKIGERDLT